MKAKDGNLVSLFLTWTVRVHISTVSKDSLVPGFTSLPGPAINIEADNQRW